MLQRYVVFVLWGVPMFKELRRQALQLHFLRQNQSRCLTYGFDDSSALAVSPGVVPDGIIG